jgi:DNA-binding CsgD family transcriptional regulator
MALPLSSAALSNLIGKIYDCALDPGRWPETLTLIHRELGFASASLTWMELPSGRPLLNVIVGVEPEWSRALPQYAADMTAQWGGQEALGQLDLAEPQVLSWVSPEHVWKGTRYYREWVEPQGMIDLMAIGVARNSGSIGGVGFGRHRDQGPVGSAEIEAARLLVPHLHRAIAISKLLDVKSAEAATFETTLDALSAAVLLLAEGRRIVHANAPARALLAAGELVYSAQGMLAVRTAAATAALDAALEQARDDESTIGRRGFGIPAWRSDGSPCVLHVLPLKFGALRPGLAPSAVAAVFVAPASSPFPTPCDTLAALFELTVAEMRVLEKLIEGLTPSEAAQSLNVGTNTIKTHLAHIYSKTGTNRQAELLNLAASLSMPA